MGAQAPPRVVFSCVAENRPEFATMAHSLAISIRSFAGELADAPIVVNFVTDADGAFVAPLADLGVEVRIVERVPGGNPLANKLRMLELDSHLEFDVLAALDCDVVVTGDPSPWLSREAIGVKGADYDRFTDEEWRSIFAEFGIPTPERVLTATATGSPIYPYFNSGVLFVPRAQCAPLRAAWTQTFADLSGALARRPDLIREQWQWLGEQASLALAILRAGLPWRSLPAELNFPSHVPVAPGGLGGPPIIVHYHGDRDSDGFLLRSRTPALDPWLDRFNRRRAEVAGTAYAGLTERPWPQRVRRAVADRFWAMVADQRWYRSAPARRARQTIKRWVAGLRSPMRG